MFWVILVIAFLILFAIGTYIEKFGAYDELRKMNKRQGRR